MSPQGPGLAVQRAHTPNYGKGRQGQAVCGTVVHMTEGTAASALSHFARSASKVSSHYLVTRGGTVYQFVEEEDTAWANGIVVRPTWPGLVHGVNPNLYTVSVEHEARTATERWPAAMLDASAQLIAGTHQRHGLPVNRDTVVGHNRIRADKACPGTWLEVDLLVRWAGTYAQLLSYPAARPQPGDLRWSDYFQANVALASYTSDAEWTFRIPRRDGTSAGPFRAEAPWSQMQAARPLAP